MNFPSELKYTKTHEWVRVEGNIATIGISDHAQHELGDIVFLEVARAVGSVLKKGDSFGTVESVKTLSDIYAPVSGKVIEINKSISDSPESVNEDPYGKAWMVKIEMSDTAELTLLMDVDSYKKSLAEAH
jgi:glycine cleavage system H protein